MKIVGNLLRVYIQVCIWTALLKSGSKDTVSLQDMVTYTIVAYIFSKITHSNVCAKLSQKVRSGTIAMDLIRPISLKWYLFFEQLSDNIFNLLFVAGPVVILSALVWGIVVSDITYLILFVISTVLSVLLAFYFQYVIGLFAFWVKDGTYTRMITEGLLEVFSGAIIPIWFYPSILKNICDWLPFRLIVFEPIAIFLGKYPLPECTNLIGLQLMWIFIFVLFEKFIWHRIQKEIVVQGG